MTKNKNPHTKTWDNATWKGSRIAQLRASLALTYQERFEALEEFHQTSEWLAQAKGRAKGDSIPKG